MQITQFIVGVLFAACHLLVSYSVPVSVPYSITEKVMSSLNATSIASAASSMTSSAALSPETGAAIAFLKKLVYRAAGDEGLAENVLQPGQASPVAYGGAAVTESPQHHFFHKNVERIVHRTEYQHVPCVDTSGEAFAVYLNMIYLAPLTVLFMRFFFKSYLKRTSPSTRNPTRHDAIAKSAGDAKRGVERELESLGQSAEDSFSSAVQNGASALRGRAAKVANADRHSSLSPENKKFVDSFKGRLSQELEKIGEGEADAKSRAKEVAKKISNSAAKADKKENAQKADKKENAQKADKKENAQKAKKQETAQEPETVQDVENPETAQEVAEAEKAKVGNAKMVTEETDKA
jgi:hypothetical protein